MFHILFRWTKLRRFNLVWDTIRKIKPSKLFNSQRVPFTTACVQKAYEDLEAGKCITAILDLYNF